MDRIRALASIAMGIALVLAVPSSARATPPFKIADAVYLDAQVITMDDNQPSAKAVAVGGRNILAVGNNAEIRRYAGPGTRTVRLDGATVLPGFIDPHSHFLGYAFFTDRAHWIDVSNVNLFFKPRPGDARCADPTDPQHCFIPVRSQDDVIDRITKAVHDVKASKKKLQAVYAMSYDPARLGHGKSCPGPETNVGFDCPNFENGHARAALDAIANDIPIFVSSQSGHIAYVNTPALEQLNICGTLPEHESAKNCREPTINPVQEKSLARSGQLDEDLALYSDSFFIGKVLDAYPLSLVSSLKNAIDIYAGHGYTLIQEGAAATSDAKIYLDIMKADPNFPFTVAMMMYDNSSGSFSGSVNIARQTEKLIKGHDDIFISGLKSFADGTPQGFTAYLSQPYNETFPPFTKPPFKQPYERPSRSDHLPDEAADGAGARERLPDHYSPERGRGDQGCRPRAANGAAREHQGFSRHRAARAVHELYDARAVEGAERPGQPDDAQHLFLGPAFVPAGARVGAVHPHLHALSGPNRQEHGPAGDDAYEFAGQTRLTRCSRSGWRRHATSSSRAGIPTPTGPTARPF